MDDRAGMNRCLPAIIVMLITLANVTGAEVHYATRLGDPATRFAPPLTSANDLRSRFSNPNLRTDIELVLQMIDWPGNVDDLYAAADASLIEEMFILKETPMPFMPTRRDGSLVVLRNVIWKNDDPAPALKFSFTSRGRLYRCVTPIACSNFYLEDIGPEPPSVELLLTVPGVVGPCEEFEGTVSVSNPYDFRQGGMEVDLSLSDGLKFKDGLQVRSIKLPAIDARAETTLNVDIVVVSTGSQLVTASVKRGERVLKSTQNTITVGKSKLRLEVSVKDSIPLGRPFEICFTASNFGETRSKSTVASLSLPESFKVVGFEKGLTETDGRVMWMVPTLEVSGSATLCVQVKASIPGDYEFLPVIDETCGEVEVIADGTSVLGISAILLEVVDLEDPIEVGSSVVYEIVTLNQGTAPATNVRVECILPPSQLFISSVGPTESKLEEAKVVFDALKSLPPGERAVWRVSVDPVSADDARFSVRMITDQLDRPVEETEATTQY